PLPHPGPDLIYALRGCSRAVLASSKPASALYFTSCQQLPGGGPCSLAVGYETVLPVCASVAHRHTHCHCRTAKRPLAGTRLGEHGTIAIMGFRRKRDESFQVASAVLYSCP